MPTVDGEVVSGLVGETPLELLGRAFSEYIDIMQVDGIENDKHALEIVDYVVRSTVKDALAQGLPMEDLERIYTTIRRLIPTKLQGNLPELVIRWRAFADILDCRMAALANSAEAVGLNSEAVKRWQEEFLEARFGRKKPGLFY